MAKTRAAKARKAARLAKLSKQVQSTCLRTVDYDPNEDKLDLEFRKSGAKYRYFGPTIKDVRRLINAASIGRTFNRTIRNDFPYERLRARRYSGRRAQRRR